MNTGNKIQKRRENLGLSREDVAKILNITEDYLQRVENGTRKPSARILFRMVVYLGLNFDDLGEKE